VKKGFKIILYILLLVLIILFGIWLSKMIFGTLALEVFKVIAKAFLRV
jgi:hypothetical protein